MSLRHGTNGKGVREPRLSACRNPNLNGLLHVAEFRHAPAEVSPFHSLRAKARCLLIGGQRFFIPPEPA